MAQARVRAIAETLLVAALCYLAGQLGALLAVLPGGDLAWLPAGVALASALIFGRRAALGVAISALATHRIPLDGAALAAPAAALLALGAALQTLAAWHLLRGLATTRARLLQQAPQAIVRIALASLIGAAGAAAALLLAGQAEPAAALSGMGRWWVGDLLGMLVGAAAWCALSGNQLGRDALRQTVILTWCVGLGVSAALFVLIWSQESSSSSLRFSALAREGHTEFEQHLTVMLHDLDALRGLYAASQSVERAEFQSFVQQHLYGEHATPGLQALSWNRFVLQGERAAFEEGLRREGFSEAQIRERDASGALVRAGDRAEYVAVEYIEPLEANRGALGYDVSSDAVRRAALLRARDTGEPSATAPISLVQGAGSATGILIFDAVYRNGAPIATAEERRAALQGFVVSVMRVDVLMDTAIRPLAVGQHDVFIFDADAPAGQQLVHVHLSDAWGARAAPPERALAPADVERGLFYAGSMEVGGRQWRLVVRPAPGYVDSQRTLAPWALLLAGLVLTAGSAIYVQGRYRLEQSLRASEGQMRELLANVPDATCAVDAAGTITFANRRLEELCGRTLGELVGRPVDLLMPEQLRARALSLRAELLAGAGGVAPSMHELAVLHRDGREIPVEINLSRLGAAGAGTIILAIRDISRRKQDEARLALSANILNVLHDFVIVGNSQGQIIYVTPAVEQILGYRPDEILGEGWWQLERGTPEELAAERDYIERAARGEVAVDQTPYEHAFRHRDGSTRWLTLRDAKGPGDLIVGVGHDITQRRAMERSLRESNERFDQIVRHIPEAFWMFDNREQRMAYVSPAYEQIFGRRAADLYRDARQYIDAIHPDDRAIMFAALARQAEGEPTEMEYRVVRPDGSTRWIFDRSSPIVDDTGQLQRTTGIATDITERRRAQNLQAAIYQIAEATRAAESLETLYPAIHHLITSVMPAANFFIALHEPESNLLRFVYWADEVDSNNDPVMSADDGLSGYVVRTRQSLLYRPHSMPAPAQAIGTLPSVWLGVPLRAGDRLIGVMATYDYHDAQAYTEHDQQVLEVISAQIAAAIDRKRSEIARRESEALKLTMFEAALDCIITIDTEGHVVEFNAAAEQTLGWSRADIQGRPLTETLIPTQLRDAHSAGMQRYLQTGYGPVLGRRIEVPARRADGQILTMETAIVPIHVGQQRWFTAFMRDISERKQAEAALRERLDAELVIADISRMCVDIQLENSATIIDSALASLGQQVGVDRCYIFLYDARSDTFSSNHEWCADGIESLTPYAEPLRAADYPGLLQPLLRGEMICIPRVADLPASDSEAQQLHDESIQSLLCLPLADEGGILGLIGYDAVRHERSWNEADISLLRIVSSIFASALGRLEKEQQIHELNTTLERRVQERTEALRASRTDLQSFLDTATDLIQSIDDHGRYVYVNDAWCQALGYSHEEAAALTMLEVVDPSYHEHCQRILEKLMAGALWQKMEVVFRTKQGGRVVVEGSVNSRIDAEGRRVTSGIFRDVTARRQAEEATRLANAELARALRLKDEFLANMSHELRTPLNGILMLSEGLLEQYHGPLSPDQQSQLQMVHSSGQHLLALINDLLDLTKIEAGKLELSIEPVIVEDACQASLQFVRQIARKKQVRLNYVNQTPELLVQADVRRLKQMLTNLLSNAVKFTDPGGWVELGVQLDPSGRWIELTVRDSGIGISAEDLPRLFQPFVQVDGSLTRRHEGTGLGLALVRRLAAEHGGRVWAESAGVPGEGSSFTLALPYDREIAPLTLIEPSKPAVATGMEQVPAAPQPLILLADDNPINVAAGSDYLHYLGYRVLIARNGREAIELARAHMPALILMDIQMPEIDGFEAIQQLRADPRFAETPIIAVTALAMQGDRERCLAAGASEYLSKPLRLRELGEVVARMIRAAGAPGE